MDYLPKAQKLLVEQGVSFKNMYASIPVCCPSRTSLYSGMYQHNHHAINNTIEGNCAGYEWVDTTEPISFPNLLKGYNKTFAGKYLNMYGQPGEIRIETLGPSECAILVQPCAILPTLT